MAKALALDLGDTWTGTALSDGSKMFARPFETVKTIDLPNFLDQTFKNEKIDTVVVGYPQTLKGTESAQTKKIVEQKEALEKLHPDKKWVFWDERYTSQHAKDIQGKKQDKHKVHSIAAALFLETYLINLGNTFT
jgi:putative holliday junction resolvase